MVSSPRLKHVFIGSSEEAVKESHLYQINSWKKTAIVQVLHGVRVLQLYISISAAIFKVPVSMGNNNDEHSSKQATC